MATYYVDASAKGANDGSIWEDAFPTIQAGVSAATSAGDVVEIAAGAYAEDIDSAANGTAAEPIIVKASTESGHSGLVYLNQVSLTDAQGGIDIQHDYITIQGPLKVECGANVVRSIYQRAGATNLTLRDVETVSKGPLYSGEDGFEAYNCKFRGGKPSAPVYSANFDKGGYLEACEFTAGNVTGLGFLLAGYIRARDTTAAGRTTTFQNCTFNGFFGEIIDVGHTTAVCTLNNCQLGGFNFAVGGTRKAPVYFAAAGTVNATNCQHVGYWKAQGFDLTSGTGTSNETNCTNDEALSFNGIKPGVGGVAFTIDDGVTASMQYASDLLDALDTTAGEVFTWYVDDRVISQTLPSGYSSYQALLQAVHNAGHEIGAHDNQNMTLLSESEFKARVLEIKAFLEAAIGGDYVCKTLSWPGGLTDTDHQTWLSEVGLMAARTTTASSEILESADIFEVETKAQPSENGMFTPDTAEADIKRQGIALAESTRAFGMVDTVLAHNSTELTVNMAKWFIQGAATTGYLKTFTDLYTEFRNNSASVATDEINWTMTFSDNSDFSLPVTAFGMAAGGYTGTRPNPVGMDGEPFSNFDTDLGTYQGTDAANHPFHPLNL